MRARRVNPCANRPGRLAHSTRRANTNRRAYGARARCGLGARCYRLLRVGSSGTARRRAGRRGRRHDGGQRPPARANVWPCRHPRLLDRQPGDPSCRGLHESESGWLHPHRVDYGLGEFIPLVIDGETVGQVPCRAGSCPGGPRHVGAACSVLAHSRTRTC